LTPAKLRADVERLTKLYRQSGRLSAKVEPKIIERDQNRLDVVFEITEGDKAYIRRIDFIGNTAFSSDKLREVVRSRVTRWYRFLTQDDTYDADRVAYDETLLRRFYLANGYPEFQIKHSFSQITEGRENFFLTFVIEEGQAYNFGSISYDNKIKNLDLEALKGKVTTVAGQMYNADAIETSVSALTDGAADQQYGFVAIRPEVKLDREARTVNITYVIDESQPIYVDRINIAGNVRTLDEVVRREFMVAEGDPYNLTKIKKAEQSIRDLDFFGKVDVKTKRGSRPDLAEIDVTVEEKSTGELSIGAGFSTADGPLADFRIRERNLLGKGQDLQLAATLSGKAQEVSLRFTEPHFMDRDLSAGFDIFAETRDLTDESSYDMRNKGFALRLGYPLGQYLRQSLQYRLDDNEIRDVEADASRYIREQEGKRLTSEVSQSLSYDRRDSTLSPTEGYQITLSNALAGLGGEAGYLSNRLRGTYYHPFFDRKVVLSTLAEAGYVFGVFDEDVQINERFFIGGNSLRGFKSSGIGPRDILTRDALGGNRYIRGSVEAAFPIGLPDDLGVKGHAFSDAGTLGTLDSQGVGIVDEESLRLSVGFGVSWQSPLGPVRADFAFPLQKEEYDEQEKFRFSFGTLF
jgi:outer membrane protein insertion porin family